MSNQHRLQSILVMLLLATASEAYFKEKKLIKLLLLGAALAPRGFVPIPIPEYTHHDNQEHHKVVHVHQGHHYGHPGYGHQGFGY